MANTRTSKKKVAPKKDWEENSLTKIFGLKKVGSILDVGCGLALKSQYLEADIRVGLDIFPEYFHHIQAKVPYVVLTYDARKMTGIFLPGSFDIVIATDIIEHLPKEEALQVIRQCEELARVAVILETPKGFIPQDIDILGHGGHEYQTHRSGWEPEELEALGYQTKLRDYLMDDVKRHTTLEVSREIQLIDAIKYI